MWIKIGLAFGALFVYAVLVGWADWAVKRLRLDEKVVPLVDDKFPLTKE